MFQHVWPKAAISIVLFALLLMTSCAPLVLPVKVSTGVPASGTLAPLPVPIDTATATPLSATAAPTSAPSATAVKATSRPSRIAVQSPDKSVELFSSNGQATQLTTTSVQFELGRPENAIADTIYAVSPSLPAGVYSIDAKGARRLDFIPASVFGWAVNAHGTPMLAWGMGMPGPASNVEIMTSAPDGSNRRSLIRETRGGEPRVLRPFQFSADGRTLYFGKEPVGLGGYILFGGLSNLWALDVSGGQATEQLSDKLAGAFGCIDGTAELLVATHCNRDGIQIFDLALKGQQPQFIQPPAALRYGQIGSAAFSPDSRRVAYALARGEASNEQGWLVVSDGVSGGSRVIGQSQPQTYFSVLGWLDAGTILVQSLSTAGPVQTGAIWLARADGGGLTKLADGTFLALLTGSTQ